MLISRAPSVKSKPALSLEQEESATKIQSFLRGCQERKSTVSRAVKLQVLNHMKSVNQIITCSKSAACANTDLMDSHHFSSEIELKIKEQKEKFSSYKPAYGGLAHRIMTESEEYATSGNIARVLKDDVSQRTMVCNSLATYLAILLVHDQSLPVEVRSQVYVCQLGGHVFVCIGNPELKSSLIADPWIAYLVLPQVNGYRKHVSLWEERERGFFGDVQSFRDFLFHHANKYVSSEYALNGEIILLRKYSMAARKLTPEILHLPK